MKSFWSFQSRDSCSYASKKNIAKMLDKYKSPVKQQVDVKLQLTPEEKLNFRVAQELDPKFLDANRKLEESLQKCNGNKFRFIIPQNRSKPGIDLSAVDDSSNKKNSEIDASVVNLNSSHDIFDEMVSATNCSATNTKDSFDIAVAVKSPNDSARLSIVGIDNSVEEPRTTKTFSSNKKYSSMKSTTVSSTSTTVSSTSTTHDILFGFSKLTDPITNSETDSSAPTKPLALGKNTGRFVYRTPTASKAANINAEIVNVDPERNKPRAAKSKAQKEDNDKYDADTVLRELSYENRLPVGANRTRPNSPVKNTHALPAKPKNRSDVQQKEPEKKNSSNIQRRLSTFSSSNSSSSTSTSISSNTADKMYTEPPAKTGFENLHNVLSRISSSSALKTTTNVRSQLRSFNSIFI